ncbi:uncharacterized protein LOC123314192 [Coccinella septempunctata]|uniref:uncharacterized protein LOC123314192 n=1 Tax=Coccinella septempunctata TaxID=41139 RepID=UPI001D07A904|nr:uncharacterized protein LOC123314192 [Coccinella septempunctata]
MFSKDRLLRALNLKPERPMKYPYTLAAQIMQFPYAFHLKNQWIWRYYVYAVIVCVPVFWKLNKMANSPGNVQKWKELKRLEKEHLKHRWD